MVSDEFAVDADDTQDILNMELLREKKGQAFLSGPITSTGVVDKMYEVVCGDVLIQRFRTRTEAEKQAAAASMMGNATVREVAVPRSPLRSIRNRQDKFEIPTGKLVVPAGTMVYVYRRTPRTDDRKRGWFRYRLKNKRTFRECHQVTTMNPGLLMKNAIHRTSNLQWIVFHTEENDYPLIAFSAITDKFPLEGRDGVHSLGGQESQAFPFDTPLRYPPRGNTFGRLFGEQKAAFLHKEGFKAGFESRKELDNK